MPESPAVRVAALFAALLLAVLARALVPSPAHAVVVNASGKAYGVTLVRGVSASQVPGVVRIGRAARRFDEPPGGGSLLESHGGPVMHSTTTHVIYWDPRGEFTTTTRGIIDGFFTHVADDSGHATNVFAVAGQYTDATGNAAYDDSSGGSLLDTDPYPTKGVCAIPAKGDHGPPYKNCILDSALQTELSSFIAAHSLPRGPTQLYFVLLPHTVVTCYEAGQCSNNVFCAYHSVMSPETSNEIVYADIPFSFLDTTEPELFFKDAKACQADGNEEIQLPNGDSTGTNASTRFADVALKYISHEAIEAETDPVPPTGWLDSTPEALEIGDKCNIFPYTEAEEGEPGFDLHAFTPTLGGEAFEGTLYNQEIHSGHYYLQSEWDNATAACLMQPAPLSAPAFSASTLEPATAEGVKFTGGVTDPYGRPEFSWNFGDGATGTGERPTHVYAEAGEYTVVMSVRDHLTGSESTPVEKTLVVDDAPEASFTSTGTTVKESIKFNAAASKDEDGKIEKYTWQFGDGKTGEGVAPEHKYAAPGVYTVTLTVEDSDKRTAKATKELRVIDAPTVETERFPPVGQTTATLKGSVNPNGALERCVFEYGEKEPTGTTLPCSPFPGPVFTEVLVSTHISGLKPATRYVFHVVATNSVEGERRGTMREFTTLPKVAPTAVEDPASSIAQTSAVVNAGVNPNGALVEECKFEYGTSVFYEASAPCGALPGEGDVSVAVSAPIAGLSANTTYHFRVVARSNAGTGVGTDGTFKTAAATPAGAGGGKTPPNSTFVANAKANAHTGAITVEVSVANPGTLGWLATFANGKFGVFSARAAKCKKGYLRLARKCRPAAIVYAKGSAKAGAAGRIGITFKPSASARKALATAARRHRGVVVTLRLTFQSALGGAPTSSTISLTVKLKKK